MDIERKMSRLSWGERVTNVKLMRYLRKEKELISTIKTYMKHVMIGEKYVGDNNSELFKSTASKIKITLMIANFRRGDDSWRRQE